MSGLLLLRTPLEPCMQPCDTVDGANSAACNLGCMAFLTSNLCAQLASTERQRGCEGQLELVMSRCRGQRGLQRLAPRTGCKANLRLLDCRQLRGIPGKKWNRRNLFVCEAAVQAAASPTCH